MKWWKSFFASELRQQEFKKRLKANSEIDLNETSEAKIMIVAIFRDQQKTLLMNKVVTRIILFKES